MQLFTGVMKNRVISLERISLTGPTIDGQGFSSARVRCCTGGQPGAGEMADPSDDAGQLIEHYRTTVELYQRLESLSSEIFDALAGRSSLDNMKEWLREKLSIVERIQAEAGHISDLKTKLQLTEPERTEVLKAEEQLTSVVGRVVEQEDRSRDLLMKQGVKISRK